MPNHWRTKIVFSKTVPQALAAQLEKWVAKTEPGLCESARPMPEILRHTGCGGTSFEIGGKKVQCTSWYENRETKESRPFTAAETKELKRLGVSDWYSWANQKWGTKWGDYDWYAAGPRTFEFHSAWGPPCEPVFQWLADTFGVSFRVYGHDEGETKFQLTGEVIPQEDA